MHRHETRLLLPRLLPWSDFLTVIEMCVDQCEATKISLSEVQNALRTTRDMDKEKEVQIDSLKSELDDAKGFVQNAETQTNQLVSRTKPVPAVALLSNERRRW